MRLIFLLPFLCFQLILSGQSCLLPESIDQLRPDRCAIRYISKNDPGVKVILEFEKEGRVLASHAPNKQTNGIRTTLRGIFELQYDQKGALLAEEKKYVQTGNLPNDCNVFGLGDQQYQKLEDGLSFISDEDYNNLPWLQPTSGIIPAAGPTGKIKFQSVVEADPKSGQLNALHLITYQLQKGNSPMIIAQRSTNLMQYDSATKKIYWLPIHEAFSNPTTGSSHLLLGRSDKKKDKFAPAKMFRYATFDTLGKELAHHNFKFDFPMDLLYTYEHVVDSGSAGLKHVLLIFRHQRVEAEINPAIDTKTLHFYVFDAFGSLVSNGTFTHDESIAPFNPFHHDWMGEGITWWHHHADRISVSHLTYSGQYMARDAMQGLPQLQTFIEKRSMNHKPITLGLAQYPILTNSDHLLYVYSVQEDISIGQQAISNLSGRSTLKLNHGILLYLVNQKGEPVASAYYQRPTDADPQAFISIGDIYQNHGRVSFLLTETTSSGKHPILILADKDINIVQADDARPVSRQIYFDPLVPLAAFFAKVPDHRTAGSYFQTIEVLRQEDSPADMSGHEPAFRK